MKCAPAECSIKRILVCVDGSENSLRAVRTAADLALSFRAQVTLLAVDSSKGPGFQPLPEEDSVESRRAYAVLDKAVQVMIDSRVLYEPMVIMGEPVDVINIVAQGDEEKEGYDMIIMGKRGTGALEHLVFGSVSEKVSQHSKVPVLVVP